MVALVSVHQASKTPWRRIELPVIRRVGREMRHIPKGGRTLGEEENTFSSGGGVHQSARGLESEFSGDGGGGG